MLTAAVAELPQVRGAFSLVFMDDTTLYAARDPQGVRPLVIGGWPGAAGWWPRRRPRWTSSVRRSLREVEPGEVIAIDERGLRSERFAPAEPKGCLFEFVYLARPDTRISGRSVHATRVEIGRILAREHPADADLVIPTPESGTPAAVGYAQASGIPFAQGLVKNAYVGRTFIQPSQTIRQLRHPAEAQPPARRDRGQAAGGRRRLDRARQHPARHRADAARGRRRAGARADLQPAGAVAVLLRDRLRHPRRADRATTGPSRRSASRSARTRWATCRWRA